MEVCKFSFDLMIYVNEYSIFFTLHQFVLKDGALEEGRGKLQEKEREKVFIPFVRGK